MTIHELKQAKGVQALPEADLIDDLCFFADGLVGRPERSIYRAMNPFVKL